MIAITTDSTPKASKRWTKTRATIEQHDNTDEWKDHELEQERNQVLPLRSLPAIDLQKDVAGERHQESHQRHPK